MGKILTPCGSLMGECSKSNQFVRSKMSIIQIRCTTISKSILPTDRPVNAWHTEGTV